MKLIINGDDLGYTRANSEGIFQAYEEGILRSTTALVNTAYFEEYVRRAKTEHPGLGVGVHLVLTCGRPLTANRTLTDPSTGLFWHGAARLFEHEIDYDEVYAEWKAQIERFIAVSGQLPTHIDSHHTVIDQSPQSQQTALKLAAEYGLQVRSHNSFRFIDSFYAEDATKEHLLQILEEYRNEDIEIMCHPGWIDLELYRCSSYASERIRELDILCSPQLREYIEKAGIELCRYGS